MIETLISAYIAAYTPSVCMTTTYGHPKYERYAGGKTIWFQRHPRYDEGVASRNLRLGTWVIIQNPRNGRVKLSRITDRGPYWKVYKGHGFIDTKNRRPGRYTGCLDISLPLGNKLGHTGLQRVRFWVVKKGSRLDRQLNTKYGCNPKRPPRWWKKRKCLTN